MLTTPRLLTDFMGVGPLANRPATPNVAAGEFSMWFDTTNNALTGWNGSAWTTLSPQSAAPTVVQSVAGNMAGATGLTLGAAPSQSDLLVAIFFSSNLPSVGAGWTQLGSNGSGIDFISVNCKVCGASESATQNFAGSAVTQGTGHLWDIKPAVAGLLVMGHGSGTTLGITELVGKSNLILGAFENVTDTTAPTSITNSGALDSNATGSSRQIQGFHASQAVGSTTYTVNYSGSKSIVGAVVATA